MNDCRRTKVFADGADLAGIATLTQDPRVAGFTTNPTLMRKSGVEDYQRFALDVLAVVEDKPVSFEVFSDEPMEMVRQAKLIAGWGENVYVKIPVMTTDGHGTTGIVRELTAEGIALNVTAILTLRQVQSVADALQGTRRAIVSVFAGRIADTGRDPVPLMRAALELLAQDAHQELLWASPREILNVCQAEEIGCHIITVTHDLLKKLDGIGRNPFDVSLDTVKMFVRDASLCGYSL